MNPLGVAPPDSKRSISATLALSTALSGGSQERGAYQANLLNRAVRSGALK
ncbi:hypothetical protein ACVIW0_007323 [Bradyrhizobium sp. USDA 4454]